MLPIRLIRLTLGDDLAANTTYFSFAPGSENIIKAVVAPFVPTENMVLHDLTYANPADMPPIVGVDGDQLVGIDPLTQEQIVTITAPAGGWRWVLTGTPTGPITVYGFALVDHADATLFATQLLDAPVTLSNIGDELDLGAVTIRFVARPMS